MNKRNLSLLLLFFVYFSAFSAYAADPEAPYNKSYLLNPQDHLYTVNIDPLNPPSSLAALTEALLNLSEGGVIVHWDREQDRPADITAEIPLDTNDPFNGLLSFLHSVKTIYGINNVTEDLELQSHNTNVVRDDFGILLHVDVIILKQVCRFNENQIIEVDGGRIIATLRSSDKRLTRLVSTFRTLECISPTNLLTESQIVDLHGTLKSELILKLAPPRPELGHSNALYIYQFIDRNNNFLEVKATNGDIIRTHSTTMNAFGLNRRVSDRFTGLKCEDSDIAGQFNSPSNGSLCSDAYLEAYNSLYHAVLPMVGKDYLTQKLGNGTDNIGWGRRALFEIDFEYNITQEPIGPAFFGTYNKGKIEFAQFPSDPSNNRQTLKIYQNNPLPGLGGAVDAVGHEVGHGYIATVLEVKLRYPSNTNSFTSPSPNFGIGRAITEGLADTYAKLSEARARYAHAVCTGSYNSSCGAHETVSCGSSTCERGEYCANNTCVACNEECGANQTQIDRATIDPKFVHTYHKTGYPVFEDDKFIRDLAPQPRPLGSGDPLSCQPLPESIQWYANSAFFSRMALSYHTAPDRLRNINGYIRHAGDVAVGEDFFKQTLLNIRADSTGPSRRDAEIAWLGSVGSLIKDTPDAVWNYGKWEIVILRGFGIILKMLTPVQGKCTSGCITGSKYECLRPFTP